MENKLRLIALALLIGLPGILQAADYQLDWGSGFDVSWSNKLAMGAQFRLASPDINTIGKSNLDPSLCAEDTCISLNRQNTEPHERWMAAPGASWQIGDEANLTYDKGDVTSGVLRWRSDMEILPKHGMWALVLNWQTFYDPLLGLRKIPARNIITEEGSAPGTPLDIDKPDNALAETRWIFDLRDAYVQFRLPSFGGREMDVRIGRQQMGWGESLFAISGTLNFINPVNFNNFFRPTMDLDEALDPVALINLAVPIRENIAAELFYQLEWRAYTLPSRGTLGSFIVDLGSEPERRGELSDDSIPLPFGKSPEDPLQQQRELTPVVALISDTAASVPRLPNQEPDWAGQYGFKLSYFAPDLFDGTEMSLYYANYHARLPAASFIAAQATCAAAESSATGQDATDLNSFLAGCGNNIGDVLANGRLVGEGFDALPLDSAAIFLEFPEDIQMLGFGFNSTAYELNWSGEVTWRPDFPMQVDLEDVFFAALQPIFPREELALFPDDPVGVGALLPNLNANPFGVGQNDLAGATFTSRRNALPDFVTAFRGGTPGEVPPSSYVRGYEEFDIWQASLGATSISGRDGSWLLADQTVLIFELSATYVPDLPPLDVLQLDSLATTNTHASPGIEETGDALKLNPFAQDPDGFPTKFAWGYKAAAIWAYDNVFLRGLRIRPQVILFHDVEGTTPGLGGNFQDDRKIGLVGVNFNFKNFVNVSMDNFIFFGGGDGNRLNDRDFLNVAVSVQF